MTTDVRPTSRPGAVSADQPSPVLVLGAGINGAAVARELVLNRIPVWVVDAHDVAFGATSRSSRLIHGGLRYLEFGELGLVRESLKERSRLLRLAPQFVRPLRLYLPIARRRGGLGQAVWRLARLDRLRPLPPAERGLWVVRLGLCLYDRLVRDRRFPKHSVVPTGSPETPRLDANRYRWLCAYTDAQILYPERFVLSLLEDARRLAEQSGTEFRLLTYHRAEMEDESVVIRNLSGDGDRVSLSPSVVVNSTGAWGDLTLAQLHVKSRRLFGGTKGSHVVTHHAGLKERLGGSGVYAEAADGRFVFVLPFGTSVLIGTTDEPFDGAPEDAVATAQELDYLLDLVNSVFPGLNLTAGDVDLHYSGVRPLPATRGLEPDAIPRGHWIDENESPGFPVYTLIGGKLTTCRALAEQVTDRILNRLNRSRLADSRDRRLPGAFDDSLELETTWKRLAEQFGLTSSQIGAVWSLCGNRVAEIFSQSKPSSGQMLSGTDLPIEFVDWSIQHEWTTTLDDLVERRLMLLPHPGVTAQTLHQLAERLVEAGKLDTADVADAVQGTMTRLRRCYGKEVRPA